LRIFTRDWRGAAGRGRPHSEPYACEPVWPRRGAARGAALARGLAGATNTPGGSAFCPALGTELAGDPDAAARRDALSRGHAGGAGRLGWGLAIMRTPATRALWRTSPSAGGADQRLGRAPMLPAPRSLTAPTGPGAAGRRDAPGRNARAAPAAARGGIVRALRTEPAGEPSEGGRARRCTLRSHGRRCYDGFVPTPTNAAGATRSAEIVGRAAPTRQAACARCPELAAELAAAGRDRAVGAGPVGGPAAPPATSGPPGATRSRPAWAPGRDRAGRTRRPSGRRQSASRTRRPMGSTGIGRAAPIGRAGGDAASATTRAQGERAEPASATRPAEIARPTRDQPCGRR
jgi:hypothetical protein